MTQPKAYILSDGTRYEGYATELSNGDLQVELLNGNTVEFSPHEVENEYPLGTDGESGKATLS